MPKWWDFEFSENKKLVGGLEQGLYFSIQLRIIIPTDEVIFFKGVETTNQIN